MKRICNNNLKTLLIKKISFLMFVFLFFSITFNAIAISSKDERLKELKEKEKEYKDLIQSKNKEEEIIKNELKNLDKQVKKLETEINQTSEEERKINIEIEKIKNKISQKSRIIEAQKELLKKVLFAKYQTYLFNKDLKNFFSSNSVKSLDSKSRKEQATSKIHEMTILLIEEQKKLKENIKKLTEIKQKINDTKFKLQEQNIYLEDLKNHKAYLANRVSREKEFYKDKLEDIELEQIQIQNEINSLSLTQLGSFSISDLPNREEANLLVPTKNPYIMTQGYGKTSFSHHYRGGHHNGIDLVAKGRKSIMSAADGVVIATGNMGRYGYGKWIAIDHRNGLVTLYGHLSIIATHKGKKVKKGQTIGTMGSTGFSTGPHLHFSVFAQKTFHLTESTKVKNLMIPTGGTVNPLMYL